MSSVGRGVECGDALDKCLDACRGPDIPCCVSRVRAVSRLLPCQRVRHVEAFKLSIAMLEVPVFGTLRDSENGSMKITIVTVLGLVGVCAMPPAARADDEADLQTVGQAVGEMVTAEAMFSAALDGDCAQYAPEKFRISRETMRLNIARSGSNGSAIGQTADCRTVEQARIPIPAEYIQEEAVDDQLAAFHSQGTSLVFACGYVLGSLTETLIHSEIRRLRALKQLGK
jgi:hypothetical protein